MALQTSVTSLHCSLIGNSNMFNLRVRLTSSDAILLWAGGRNYGDSEADFIMLSVEAGFVQVSV